MQKLKNTQLIVTAEGAIYHLNLKPENLADTVIIVGDPGRVPTISKYFDEIEFQGQNREINTHTGRIGKKKITVLSSGMGPDNIDIVINELDALANIDLGNKTINPEHKALNLIRLGTSGAVQKDIEVDSFVMSKYGLGLDGVLNFYKVPDGIIEKEMCVFVEEQIEWPEQIAQSYIVKCTDGLAKKIGFDMHQGITVTAPGFYGPQGRTLRMELNFPDFIQKLETFRYKDERILNFEMETSALYGLGRSLGHNVLTICAVIANRITEEYSSNHHKPVETLIKLLLERITA
ncbi:MAG: nucleoside phosphorylase [Bacteroidetes bacterium]|nr:nucleoside phosphorylase [Bacteroidota bacterium]